MSGPAPRLRDALRTFQRAYLPALVVQVGPQGNRVVEARSGRPVAVDVRTYAGQVLVRQGYDHDRWCPADCDCRQAWYQEQCKVWCEELQLEAEISAGRGRTRYRPVWLRSSWSYMGVHGDHHKGHQR